MNWADKVHPQSLPPSSSSFWLLYRKEPNMLVLSRHRDESIMIGDNIVITVVDVRGDKVRLGIDAPTDIPVHRQEVYDAIQRERQAKKNEMDSEAK
jgi:carbon storage regulator